MTKKTLLTAQGGGFYGMSILTTEMPTSDVVQAVQNVGGKFVESEELSSFLFPLSSFLFPLSSFLFPLSWRE